MQLLLLVAFSAYNNPADFATWRLNSIHAHLYGRRGRYLDILLVKTRRLGCAGRHRPAANELPMAIVCQRSVCRPPSRHRRRHRLVARR